MNLNLRGSDVICILFFLKIWRKKNSLNSARVRALEWPLLEFFSRDFSKNFLGGSGVGGGGRIICREYLIFRGSDISFSVACAKDLKQGLCLYCGRFANPEPRGLYRSNSLSWLDSGRRLACIASSPLVSTREPVWPSGKALGW